MQGFANSGVIRGGGKWEHTVLSAGVEAASTHFALI